MANIKSQMKRIKTNEKARMRNKMHRSDLRTAIKKIEVLISEDMKKAQEYLPTIYKKVDSAVSKGIIHQNKANRIKSTIASKINESAPTTTPKKEQPMDKEENMTSEMKEMEKEEKTEE